MRQYVPRQILLLGGVIVPTFNQLVRNGRETVEKKAGKKLSKKEKLELIAKLKTEMKEAAKLLEFEHAAYLRDKIKELEGNSK